MATLTRFGYLLDNCRIVEGRTEAGAGDPDTALQHFVMVLSDFSGQIARLILRWTG
jgi:hypothetical protein